MPDKNPLVRSQQLAPLSREHHEGLLFAWRIREGLKKDTSLQTINDFITWFWKNHLESHFEDEEKTLALYLPPNDELIKRMMQEHEAIRWLLPDGKLRSALELKLLSQHIHDHIRFEERELFPYIEKKLTTDQLNEIFLKIDHPPHCLTDWKIEFWTNG